MKSAISTGQSRLEGSIKYLFDGIRFWTRIDLFHLFGNTATVLDYANLWPQNLGLTFSCRCLTYCGLTDNM